MKMNSFILAMVLLFAPAAYAADMPDEIEVTESNQDIPAGEVKLSDALIKENMDSLYKYNELAFGYMMKENDTEEYVYVLSKEDIPCFINFKSKLMAYGSSKNVKAIPVRILL